MTTFEQVNADQPDATGRRVPVGWLAYGVGLAIALGLGATTDGFSRCRA